MSSVHARSGIAAVWVRSRSIVTRSMSASARGGAAKSGTMLRIGSSSARRPSEASDSTVAATTILLTEATRKRVSRVTGRSLPRRRTPTPAANRSSPSITTASAPPGTPRARSRSCQASLSASNRASSSPSNGPIGSGEGWLSALNERPPTGRRNTAPEAQPERTTTATATVVATRPLTPAARAARSAEAVVRDHQTTQSCRSCPPGLWRDGATGGATASASPCRRCAHPPRSAAHALARGGASGD